MANDFGEARLAGGGHKGTWNKLQTTKFMGEVNGDISAEGAGAELRGVSGVWNVCG